MRMGMQLILPLLSLCMLLHGSSGNNASPSSAKYSALHPIEKAKPNRTYHVKSVTASQPTASLLSNATLGLVLQSAVVSPTYKGVPVPQTIHGIVPSIPPSTPMAVPHKSAAPPRTMPQIASPIQPSRQIKGPHISRLPPQVMPQLTPSIQPSPPLVVLPISAPPYQIMPRVEPSIPPSPIGVPRNSAPPPQIMTQVEPLRPSPPIGVPSHKLAPLNPTLPKLVPPIPPSPPTIVPQISASPPKIMRQVASYIPPSPPIVLPHNSASPTQIMPRLAPAVQPSSPFVVPSDKLAPLSQTMPKLVPPIPPSPPILVPPSKLGPLPQTIPELAPSSPPSPSIVGPSNKAPPLSQSSQTMPPLAPGVSPSPPIGVPSHNSTPQPQTMPHLPPSIPPTPPFAVPSHKLAPPQQAMPRQVPSTPTPLSTVPSHKLAPPIPRLVPSITPNPPSAVPSHNLAPLLQTMPRLAPSVPPSDSSHKKMPELPLPVTVPNAQVPVAMSPRESPLEPPTMYSIIPGVPPSALSAPPPSSRRNKNGMPVPAPPKEIVNHLSPMNRPPKKGTFPVLAPKPHKVTRPSDIVPAPSMSSSQHPGRKWTYSPASSPPVPIYKHHHAWKRASGPSFTPFHSIVPPTYHQGPIILPTPSVAPTTTPSVAPTAPSHAITSSPKKSREMHHNPVPPYHGPSASPFQSAFPTKPTQSSLAPSPSSTDASTRTKRTFFPPTFSPPKSSPMKPKATLPPPTQALPPPPPNQDCTSLACTEPLTNSPPGSPCACVSPIQVGLRLSVALYTFFPLVSELAEEIASGVYLKQSQVRVMGANAASEQLDKTVVLIDLVPLGERFDNTTAFLTYEKFWYKQVAIKSSFFGDYEVLYVRYPGLPPSPPSAPSSMDTIDGSYSNQGNNARMIHPLGVDVRRKQKKGLGGGIIAIIVLSSFAAVVLFIGAAWFFLIKHGGQTTVAAATPQTFVPSLAKQSGRGVGGSLFGSGLSSASPSFGSSITTYTGSAKTFSAEVVERITNNFDELRVLGEGGFGRVYKGVMEDGTEVAVKVLKRDDQQGGREFFAEVEMLSRLHHRNLVKLIGICVEEHARSLIYELIPNGSLESHLHGVDKEIAPLDWGARIKIALGAARGLAYLHEDSSPHVIHRDFKSSNILLEHDFTPKVSDFGLAKTALEEGHRHISTRVMGTFGYVAPEYAMTGHLLVKSDVYSYGVVLLEILTGRKPVDMSQPQGQENLVAWARPLLTSKVGLEMIIDPALDSNVPFDSVAKVAAIASMCVQPEVSHRPFMGEVVQALKLVCNECDDAKEAESESCGQEDSSVIDIDTRTRTGSCQLAEPSRTHCSDYDTILEGDRELSASYIFSTSGQFGLQPSRSFRRHSSSGPLRSGRSRQFWQTVRGLSRGSVSEHGVAFRLWAGSH